MADQGGFGNDGSESTRLRKANYSNDQMNEKEEDVAHCGILSKLQNRTNSLYFLQFATHSFTPVLMALPLTKARKLSRSQCALAHDLTRYQ